ncbi:hypothetical protein JAAARDRAFT_38630 [Jaapia argillacea MUCL 33604]|uniref:Phosphatidate cytidylyltransferase n=1 Tax=Jaapia argillacea MUCL 33604 TaxID=933084 RepID=A0A067PRV8_9AGAM|nr:hypothetical protein JAAARDRAFT_38630 [Jaapia argillacea MUCL 33604]
MSLPANDAFSLGFGHDSIRRSRGSTRSPSPKLPFTPSRSPSLSRSRSADLTSPANTRPRRTSRRINSHTSTHSSKLADVREVDDHTLQKLAQNGVHTTARREKQATKIDWEIPRKALHSSIGFLTLHLYISNSTTKYVLLGLYVGLAVIVPADILRLNFPAFARLYERFLGFLMRESEKKSTNGTIWYIIGVLFVLTAFPLDIAVVSILILSWADTAASTIGRAWGRYTPPLPNHILGIPFARRKSLAGFLAATVTGACIAAGFWTWIAPMRESGASWSWDEGVIVENTQYNWLPEPVKDYLRQLDVFPINTSGWLGIGMISTVAGVVSGVAEALDVGSLDDNLTLPIISGSCIWGFFKLLGLFSS